MPQLLLLALVALGGYFVWKAVKREIGRVDRELNETRAEKAKQQAKTLEQDPETGRYRPKQDEG